MNLSLIKIVGVAVGVAGMTVETRAAEMQEYVAERDNTQVSVWTVSYTHLGSTYKE